MGTPNYPRDMGTEWMNLKKAVKDAFTSANSRVPYQKIAAGILKVSSSLEVLAGAFISFVYSGGELGMILGRHITGDLEPAEGMFLRRNDGSIALWIFNRISDAYGFTAIYDQSGNGIFTDDGNSKKGIGRPWLSHTFWNYGELTNPPASRLATGTTDVPIITSFICVQHPRIHYVGYLFTAVGGATAEIKFKDPGLGTTLHAVTGTDGWISGEFTINADHTFGDDKNIEVSVRRASGSGNVGFTLVQLSGCQS